MNKRLILAISSSVKVSNSLDKSQDKFAHFEEGFSLDSFGHKAVEIELGAVFKVGQSAFERFVTEAFSDVRRRKTEGACKSNPLFLKSSKILN